MLLLNGTAIPELHRGYPYTDLTGAAPVMHQGPPDVYEAYKRYIGLGSDSESEWESESE